MEQIILSYLSGYVRIKISGKHAERFFTLCAFHNIRIWNLVSCDDWYEGNISRKDFLRLRPVLRKSRASIRIIKKYGCLFWFRRHKKRKLFLGGCIASIFLLLFLSLRVWNIQIVGNVSCSDEQMIEYLDRSGIKYGTKKSDVNCKSLAAQIRNEFDAFSWVSTELKGTVLYIQVKENPVSNILPIKTEYKENENASSSLYAMFDGTIRSIFVRNGVSLVAAGDEVKKGKILVSGAVPVYNDAGEISSFQYVESDADIVIERKVKYIDTVYFKNKGRLFLDKERKRYILKAGRIVLGFPPGTFQLKENHTVLQELKQLKLFEHFYLPVYIRKITVKSYDEAAIIYTKEKCEQLLLSDFECFKKNLEEKGVQIFENDVKIEWNEKSAILSGDVTVGEVLLERRPVADVEEEIQKNEYG